MSHRTGYEVHGWRKGMVVKRRGRFGVLLDDGHYYADDTMACWYFRVEWQTGMEGWLQQIIAPEEGDEVTEALT